MINSINLLFLTIFQFYSRDGPSFQYFPIGYSRIIDTYFLPYLFHPSTFICFISFDRWIFILFLSFTLFFFSLSILFCLKTKEKSNHSKDIFWKQNKCSNSMGTEPEVLFSFFYTSILILEDGERMRMERLRSLSLWEKIFFLPSFQKVH